MPISENMVQEIVQEVMAKMQIADAPAGKHGVFKDMNDAIEAAKKAQLVVKTMSMDQREKMIQDDLNNAAETKKAANKLKAEYEGNVQAAQDKAAEMTKEAKKTAELQKNNIIASANDQAKEIVDKAQKNAQLEYDKTMSKLESEIAGLALVAATKVVKEQSSSSDTSSYDEFLGEEDK